MSERISDHGINFRYAVNGALIRTDRIRVNPCMVKPLAKLCCLFPPGGCIYTYGIKNNRLMRRKHRTSRHAEGTYKSGYKQWLDGTHGSRAIDIRKVYFGRPITFRASKYGFLKQDLTTDVLVCTDPVHRKIMIDYLEQCGFTVYHKRLGLVSPDHLHAEC